jgi:alkylhydroperoxidase/carboxymuconolactone decarboxylase family protein YurZ
MDRESTEREKVERILDSIERKYGFIPKVNQVMSERPDLFIPAIGFSKAVLENPTSPFDDKFRYLLALSAAAALGSQYCLDVQIKHAMEAGATKKEVMDTIMIGSYMAMSRSQSIALREYEKNFNDKE